jgi:hypothetical protein
MLNVFDIFKVLIGIVIFVLLITLFLRFSGSYSELGETGQQYDAVNAFDTLLRNTYTSGNPGEFGGFGKIEVTFDPPGEPRPSESARIVFPSGQKTLSVPAFVMTGEGKMAASRTCDDYGWFSFCYVISMPMDDTVLFSPVTGLDGEKNIIRGVVESLPPGVTVGYCDGSDLLPAPDTGNGNRQNFLDTLGHTVIPCTAEIPEGYWLVSFSSGEVKERTVSVVSGVVSDSSGDQDIIIEYSDVTVALCGPGTLKHKRALFEKRLAMAASVMRDRTIIVQGKMKELNVEPCRGCPTPYPKPCGYMDIDGNEHESESALYPSFRTSLTELIAILTPGAPPSQVISKLDVTAGNYKALEVGGCE